MFMKKETEPLKVEIRPSQLAVRAPLVALWVSRNGAGLLPNKKLYIYILERQTQQNQKVAVEVEPKMSAYQTGRKGAINVFYHFIRL